MDDEFLTRYRRTPRPEFARQLQERIDIPMNTPTRTWGQTLKRLSPALLAVALLAAALLVFTFPPAQALAQDFLGLFRVQKFATVTFDSARMDQLQARETDFEHLLADNVQVITDPGDPVTVKSLEQASKRAGFNVAVPSAAPDNAKLEIQVQGEGEVKLTGDTAKLQSILDALGITDVQIPAALNGAVVNVRKPAAVMLTYTTPRGEVSLMQSPSPEVNLPPGVNLAQLGEIGLRVLGLNASQAHEFAQKVDWNSTFLIPIPANAAEVRQVNVNGADGLMISGTASTPNRRRSFARGDNLILWAKDGMVYALHGDDSELDLLTIANSVQ